MRAWYKKNREKILARLREKRAANRDSINAYHRDWRAANPEKAHGYHADWAKRNPGKCVERVRRWQRANPDKVKTSRQRAAANARTRKAGGEQITLPLESRAPAPGSARESAK